MARRHRLQAIAPAANNAARPLDDTDARANAHADGDAADSREKILAAIAAAQREDAEAAALVDGAPRRWGWCSLSGLFAFRGCLLGGLFLCGLLGGFPSI